jgi:hypothetical protein
MTGVRLPSHEDFTPVWIANKNQSSRVTLGQISIHIRI